MPKTNQDDETEAVSEEASLKAGKKVGKRRWRVGTGVLRKMARVQRTQKLVLPRACVTRAFRRAVERECKKMHLDVQFSCSRAALDAVHQTMENRIYSVLHAANRSVDAQGRVTVEPSDVDCVSLIASIMGCPSLIST